MTPVPPPRLRARTRRACGRWLDAACAAALLAGGGCVTEGGGGRAASPPPPPPANVTADTLLLSASTPVDSDANGYPDTFVAAVYLFAQSTQYPLPVVVDGTFIFRLSGSDGRTLAEWTFPPDEATEHQRLFGPGPGYEFQLRLQDAGVDRLAVASADLAAAFVPAAGGATVRSGAVSLPFRR